MKSRKAFRIILLIILALVIFVTLWWLSAMLAFAGTIIVTYLLRDNPAMDLEMGWIAIMIIVPPLIAFLISIPATVFIMRRINKKVILKGNTNA